MEWSRTPTRESRCPRTVSMLYAARIICRGPPSWCAKTRNVSHGAGMPTSTGATTTPQIPETAPLHTPRTPTPTTQASLRLQHAVCESVCWHQPFVHVLHLLLLHHFTRWGGHCMQHAHLLRISHTMVSHTAPRTCAAAATGNYSEYLQAQVNSASFYSNVPSQNKFGWYPVSCSGSYQFVCEVPFTSLGCKAPPPVPPPAPPATLCKLQPGWPAATLKAALGTLHAPQATSSHTCRVLVLRLLLQSKPCGKGALDDHTLTRIHLPLVQACPRTTTLWSAPWMASLAISGTRGPSALKRQRQRAPKTPAHS